MPKNPFYYSPALYLVVRFAISTALNPLLVHSCLVYARIITSLPPPFFLHVDFRPTFREFRVLYAGGEGGEGRSRIIRPSWINFLISIVCINWWPMYVCQVYDTLFDAFSMFFGTANCRRRNFYFVGEESSNRRFRRWWNLKIVDSDTKRTHLWSLSRYLMFLWGRRGRGEGGLDGTSYCTGHLTGCLLYSCVNRLKRIYATFRGDEWINKRIINRNLISSTSK